MKMWNQGDERVEKYMPKIAAVIRKHIKSPDQFTDIYNKAYESVWDVITDKENKENASDSKYWIEHFHSVLMKNFHKFRIEKVGEDEINITITGSDLNKIIAEAKMSIYKRMK